MFGPADDQLIKQWTTEGRVGADSHVWRTGWPDWRLARDLPEYFPSLAGSAVPTPAVELPVGYNETPASEVARPTDPHDPAVVAARYQRRKRRSAASQQLAAVLLGVLVVVLAGVLVWVVVNANSDSKPDETTAPPAVTTPEAKPQEPANNAEAPAEEQEAGDEEAEM
ncbi:hypothetical protein Pan181_50680 [Aeoliella mucimassa]|uniref:GYF domain-containing protein n=2 Tax=Aeoliella mucimassa TaxID=2527972 RepID=A0A518AVS8_9BACT|nr:hypothetical protein Pan181_50680 [Aeoliella mucimassa]